jgi:hypothetical protein
MAEPLLYDASGTPLPPTAPAAPGVFREAAGVLDDESAGWVRLTGNPTRDLSPMKQDRQIEIAQYL